MKLYVVGAVIGLIVYILIINPITSYYDAKTENFEAQAELAKSETNYYNKMTDAI